jgi:ATPase subunit of ABC transporter with duplicated ATPase domains
MILHIQNLHKSIGSKELFSDLSLKLEKGEKVALIGRNGLGKTTLFNIINGDDKDFTGEIERRKDLRTVMTRQEHFFDVPNRRGEVTSPLPGTALEYILNDVPEYYTLKSFIAKTDINSDIPEEIEKYSEAVHKFTELGYYDIEDEILRTLESFEIDFEKALAPFSTLSGGEKRFVELTRVIFSKANLALIDEPTNHMDYVGKRKFIEWLNLTRRGEVTSPLQPTIFVITHDRDVLKNMDRIVELKDKKIFSFNGNYDAYLKQNSLTTVSSINKYDADIDSLKKLHRQMVDAKNRKIEAKTKKGQMQAKKMQDRFEEEFNSVKENLERPSFWIDQESKGELANVVVERYEKFKEKNIKLHESKRSEGSRPFGTGYSSGINSNKIYKKVLLKVKELSVGYERPLFENLSFEMMHGDRVYIKGRNGVGKSTLIKTIIGETQITRIFKGANYTKEQLSPLLSKGLSSIQSGKRTKGWLSSSPLSDNITDSTDTKLNHPGLKATPPSKGGDRFHNTPRIFSGTINYADDLRLGIYEQEVNPSWLDMTLRDAIYKVYENKDINEQGVMNLLGQYLFNPIVDANVKIRNLSGGQKARLQLIKMMVNDPNLLILDEPTNHLDLPSIEELESTLLNYHGAIIYISHDSYFVEKMGGDVIEI